MSELNPFDDAVVFDTVVFITPTGKATLPGRNAVHVKSMGGLKEDKKDVPGVAGLERTYLGHGDALVTITNTVIDAEGWHKVKAIARLFNKHSNAKPFEFEVVNPIVNELELKRFYIKDISMPEFNRRNGFVTIFELMGWEPRDIKSKVSTNATVAPVGDGVDNLHDYLVSDGMIEEPTDPSTQTPDLNVTRVDSGAQ